MEQLRQLLEKLERSGPDSQLEKQVLNAANRAQSQVNQAEAVGRMMQNNALKNKDGIAALIAQAGKAAAQRAESAASALMAWGDGPDSGDPKKMEADRELIKRVCRNKVLMETARYLGRLKELIQGKRKSGYAYGRGEKYSVELGGDINRALGSEFAMLAAPETLPLFLRKLQRKGLKQYQRREPVCKGSGDIICMLDESGSAEEAAPWCKAVALALLDIAIQGKRRFAMIHFSSTGHFQTDLFLPGEFDREDVLKAAETFLGGNTDYKTPLQEVTVVSTGESQKMIIKGQDNQMTEEEVKKRMEELAYLKIQPRDYEENRLVLLRAERMYEESLGDRRRMLDRYITAFEAALKGGDHDEIQDARDALNELLEDEEE